MDEQSFLKSTGFAGEHLPMSGELQRNIPHATPPQTDAMKNAFPGVPDVRTVPFTVEKEGASTFLGYHEKKENVVGQDVGAGEVAITSEPSEDTKKDKKDDNKKKMMLGAGILMLGAALFLGSTYRKETDKEKKSRFLIMTLGFSVTGFAAIGYAWKKMGEDVPVAPQKESLEVIRTRSAPDPVIGANPPATPQQPRPWNTEMQTGEGPRPGLAYDFGPNGPQNLPRLGMKDLMRNTAGPQMTEEEFKVYMARLEGRAVDQYHGVDPSMAFGAERSHFVHNNDDREVYDIIGEPSRYQAKWPAREPRINQAGAQRMHLKDPPPGSVPPAKSEVHPWMEQDLSGKAPPVMLNDNGAEKQNAHEVASSYIEETQQLMKPPRTSENRESEFMQPVNVKRLPTSLKLEREELGGMPSQSIGNQQQQQFSADAYAIKENPRVPPQPEKGQAPKNPQVAAFHNTVDEFDDGQDLQTNSFASFFEPKNTPSDEEVNQSMQDIRR